MISYLMYENLYRRYYLYNRWLENSLFIKFKIIFEYKYVIGHVLTSIVDLGDLK